MLLAKNRIALTDMMDTIRKFLKDRKLKLCAEKTKIIVFNKHGNKKKETWMHGNGRVERLRRYNVPPNFKYLDFIFNRKDLIMKIIRFNYEELSRKGRVAAKKLWGLCRF